MNNKSKRLNLIICGAAFVILIVYMFASDDPAEVINALTQAKPGYLLLAVMCMVAYWLLESLELYVVMKAIHPPHKFKESVTVSLVGQYFNCITPFASGGQPIQAYYLVKYGAQLSSAMTALLSKFISYQFVLTIYSAVILLLRFTDVSSNPAMMTMVLIGFVVNTCVIIALFMLAFFRKATTKISHFVVRLLGKIRIIKDVDEKLKFIDAEMELYYRNFLFIKSKPLIVLKLCLLTFVQLTIYFSISFVIYLGFGLSGTDYLTIISCQAFVLMIAAFIPLPGAMGASEGSYVFFFKDIFGIFVNLSTFIWRFLTFYLAIIVGFIVSLIANKRLGSPAEKDEK